MIGPPPQHSLAPCLSSKAPSTLEKYLTRRPLVQRCAFTWIRPSWLPLRGTFSKRVGHVVSSADPLCPFESQLTISADSDHLLNTLRRAPTPIDYRTPSTDSVLPDVTDPTGITTKSGSIV